MHMYCYGRWTLPTLAGDQNPQTPTTQGHHPIGRPPADRWSCGPDVPRPVRARHRRFVLDTREKATARHGGTQQRTRMTGWTRAQSYSTSPWPPCRWHGVIGLPVGTFFGWLSCSCRYKHTHTHRWWWISSENYVRCLWAAFSAGQKQFVLLSFSGWCFRVLRVCFFFPLSATAPTQFGRSSQRCSIQQKKTRLVEPFTRMNFALRCGYFKSFPAANPLLVEWGFWLANSTGWMDFDCLRPEEITRFTRCTIFLVLSLLQRTYQIKD